MSHHIYETMMAGKGTTCLFMSACCNSYLLKVKGPKPQSLCVAMSSSVHSGLCYCQSRSPNCPGVWQLCNRLGAEVGCCSYWRFLPREQSKEFPLFLLWALPASPNLIIIGKKKKQLCGRQTCVFLFCAGKEKYTHKDALSPKIPSEVWAMRH